MAQRRVSVVLDAAVSGFQRGMQQARQQSQSFGQSLERNAGNLTRLGVGMTAASAVMVAGMRSVARETAEFDSRIMRLTTLVGIAEEEARSMGQAMMGLGETGRGPQELADALFDATSAGFRGAEALDLIETSAKAASIGLGDTRTITALATSAVNAYGAETLTAAEATDFLAGAVRAGKLEAETLAPVMGRILPTASALGIAFEDVAGAMAVMSRTGAEASEISTTMVAIMSTLQKPTEEASRLLDSVGLSMGQLREMAGQPGGLIEVMRTLESSFAGNDEALAAVVPNVRAFRGVMNVLAQDSAVVDQVMMDVAGSVGLVDEAFAQWSETTEAAQARFSAAMEAAKITAGEDFQPVMRSLLNTGTSLAESFADLNPEVRRFGSQAAIAGSAVLGLSGTALTTAGSLAMLSAALKGMGTSLGAVAVAGGPVAVTLGAVTLATLATINAIEDARSEGRLFAAEARANADTVAEAQGMIRGRIDEVRDSFFSLGEVAKREALGALPGVLGNIGDVVARIDLGRFIGETDELGSALETTGESFSLLRDRWDEPFTNPFRDPTDGAQDLTGAFGDLEDAVDEATSALSRHEEQLRAMTDPIFGVMSASQNLEDAMSNLDETQGDTEASAEDLAVAERDVAEAAIELLGRMGELDGALEDGTLTVDGLRNALQPLVDSGLIPQSVFDRLIDDFDETTGMVWDYIRATDSVPPDLDTVIRLHGANEARLTLLEFGRLLDSINRDVRIRLQAEGQRVSPGVEIRHRGGRVGMDPAPTTTLTSPIRPNERLILAEVGERVVTEHQWHAMQAPSVQVMHAGGVVGGGGGSVNHFHFPRYVGDRHELVDEMNRAMAERAHDNAGVG